MKGEQYLKKTKDINQDIKIVKSKNTLSASEYKKVYIIYFGYRFEEPNNLLMMDLKNFKPGKKLEIKKWTEGGMKTVTAVSETIKIDSSVQNEVVREDQDFSDGDQNISPVKSTRQANVTNDALL